MEKENNCGKNKNSIFANLDRTSSAFLLALYFAVSLLFLELALHVMAFDEIGSFVVYAAFSSVAAGIFLAAVASLFGKRGSLIFIWTVMGFAFVYYSAQLIYLKIFGSFFSVSQIGMGADAVTGFFKETVDCVLHNLHRIFLLALPLVALGVLLKFKKLKPGKAHFLAITALAVCFVISCVVCQAVLKAGGTLANSAYDAYHNPDTPTDKSVRRLGVLVTAKQESYFIITGKSSNLLSSIQAADSTDEEEAAPTPKGKNELEGMDFAALNEYTDNSDVAALNDYFASMSATDKNEYTGMFEGYNLITFCAESFSPYLIDPVRTPTLYKLSHEGFVFTNYYNSMPNVTTNGEYAFVSGLMPDFTRAKTDASMKYSENDYMPYCLGNMFDSINVPTYAYHNYYGYYYDREYTYPNMGYETIKFMGDGMEFSTEWPTSDLEMLEQSVDDYINEPQFHAYYMTFSGHYQYNFRTNPMCIRNEDFVADMPYGEAVSAYIACNNELEKALTYLMQRLDEAGIADKTVIVLTGDHYPYGLEDYEYNELAGREIDTTFGKYKGSFICWSGGMDRPVLVNDYCCNIDILPTLLNLFGFEYDSRLLAGTDVLSNSMHMAVLSNGSILTSKLRYDADNDQLTFTYGNSNVNAGYVEKVRQAASNKFVISNAILYNDYYRFVYDNYENVKVTAPQGGAEGETQDAEGEQVEP